MKHVVSIKVFQVGSAFKKALFSTSFGRKPNCVRTHLSAS